MPEPPACTLHERPAEGNGSQSRLMRPTQPAPPTALGQAAWRYGTEGRQGCARFLWKRVRRDRRAPSGASIGRISPGRRFGNPVEWFVG
jgi:hypothetical protein